MREELTEVVLVVPLEHLDVHHLNMKAIDDHAGEVRVRTKGVLASKGTCFLGGGERETDLVGEDEGSFSVPLVGSEGDDLCLSVDQTTGLDLDRLGFEGLRHLWRKRVGDVEVSKRSEAKRRRPAGRLRVCSVPEQILGFSSYPSSTASKKKDTVDWGHALRQTREEGSSLSSSPLLDPRVALLSSPHTRSCKAEPPKPQKRR